MGLRLQIATYKNENEKTKLALVAVTGDNHGR